MQEALTNAVRHAGATRIQIDVSEHDGCVDLAVADDGRGFDPATTDSGGFGLTGMRERVELADGELDIDSGPSRAPRSGRACRYAGAPRHPARTPRRRRARRRASR